MFSVMKTEKNAIHAPRCEGKLASVGQKLAGLIQRNEDKIHLKLNTIKSVKTCDAFPFSNKIIRVSYCAIANTHLCFSSHLEAILEAILSFFFLFFLFYDLL